MKEKDKLILVGDIHGEFRTLYFHINRYDHRDAHIIQLGDFGVGYNPPAYYEERFIVLNAALKRRNVHLYAFRGNHDNPSFFKTTHNPFDLSNITILADYSELDILGKKILVAGGAVSVDREDLIYGTTVWYDEEFQLKQDKEFYKGKKYDLVLTHTRPAKSGAQKGFDNIQHYINNDRDLKEDLIVEGQCVDVLYNLTKPPLWFYGHFHKSIVTKFENTTFRCINVHEHFVVR